MSDDAEVKAQVTISLMSNSTTKLECTGDNVVSRFLLSKGLFILDWQEQEQLRQAQADAARIVTPNGAARRLVK